MCDIARLLIGSGELCAILRRQGVWVSSRGEGGGIYSRFFLTPLFRGATIGSACTTHVVRRLGVILVHVYGMPAQGRGGGGVTGHLGPPPGSDPSGNNDVTSTPYETCSRLHTGQEHCPPRHSIEMQGYRLLQSAPRRHPPQGAPSLVLPNAGLS